jgi:glycosyltransferase involved in cell wall biosynthesis
MKISVIIPVYNAEKYVRKAVESALQQAETDEILLVEDNSPDNCLQICQDLEKEHEKIRLLRHPDGKNHGAGATRNLGIKNAKFDYIAFLDADDFYLPDRFVVAKKLFQQRHDIDGVYEATGVHFHDPQVRQRWFSSGGDELATIIDTINPIDLFEALIKGRKGYIHLDGLVVKKNIFEHCGYFFEHLRLHQDTAMLFQMSACDKLIPGRLNAPVAMRGMHGENRITSEYNWRQTRFLLWKTLFYWAHKRKLKNSRLTTLFLRYTYSSYRLARGNGTLSLKNWPQLKELLFESLRHPFLFIGAISEFVYNKYARQGFPS